MELTRRDAILALAGGGLVGSAAVAEEVTGSGRGSLSGSDREALRSTAEILYPTSVTITDDFVETYVLGRQAVDEEYLAGMTEALETVRSTSRSETGRSYPSLDGGRRDAVLRATGADRAYPDPDGTVVFERTVSLSSGEQVAYRYAVPADRVPAAGNATTYTLAVRFDDGRSASREYRVRRALLGVTVTLAGDGRVGFGQYVA